MIQNFITLFTALQKYIPKYKQQLSAVASYTCSKEDLFGPRRNNVGINSGRSFSRSSSKPPKPPVISIPIPIPIAIATHYHSCHATTIATAKIPVIASATHHHQRQRHCIDHPSSPLLNTSPSASASATCNRQRHHNIHPSSSSPSQ